MNFNTSRAKGTNPNLAAEKSVFQPSIFSPTNKPDIITRQVPQGLALGDDHYYIHYGSWFAGVQLTRDEAYRAIELVGTKRDAESIYWAIEQAIDGGEA